MCVPPDVNSFPYDEDIVRVNSSVPSSPPSRSLASFLGVQALVNMSWALQPRVSLAPQIEEADDPVPPFTSDFTHNTLST